MFWLVGSETGRDSDGKMYCSISTKYCSIIDRKGFWWYKVLLHQYKVLLHQYKVLLHQYKVLLHQYKVLLLQFSEVHFLGTPTDLE